MKSLAVFSLVLALILPTIAYGRSKTDAIMAIAAAADHHCILNAGGAFIDLHYGHDHEGYIAFAHLDYQYAPSDTFIAWSRKARNVWLSIWQKVGAGGYPIASKKC